MAVAGLHTAAVLESSLLRDSHSHTPGRQGDGGRGGTRSSSILQMWRDIEDEQVVRQVQGRPGGVLLQQRSDGLVSSLPEENMADGQQIEGHMVEDAVLGENESEAWSQSQSHDEREEFNNSSRENSLDLGEVERVRVRQIFREWVNNGSRGDAYNISLGNNGSREEWLGEAEQERVSMTREWVQMSSQQRGVSSAENREEQSTENGAQNEQVRDGFDVNQNEGQSEHMGRGIRKLRGRQVFLDMLKKAAMDRQREIQELLSHRVVSHFPHRNRIQVMLRGRFLRNDRSIDNNRSTSITESELGLLRQKQPVSGLREEFASRNDNLCFSQATCNLSDTSSDSGFGVNIIEQTGSSCSEMVPILHSEQSGPNNGGSDSLAISGGQIYSQGTTHENLDWRDSNAHIETRDSTGQNANMMLTEDAADDLGEVHTEQHQLGDITGDESNLSNPNNNVEGNIIDVDSSGSVAVEGGQHEEVAENDQTGWHQTDIEWRDSTQESVDDNRFISTSNEWPENILVNEDGENSHLLEQEAPETWQEDGSFQEAVEIWLGRPSDNEVAPVGRIHGFYFPEDDNVYSVELRELLSRRSVSNLLRSSFRESLDQLIQSYVERQGHAHNEWELQETSPSSPLAEQDLGQQSRDQIVGPEGTANSSLDLPLPPTPPPQPSWNRHSRYDNWSQNDEWEVVNDLRIEMVRLQQRMNNMQRLLEACMDMQLELQRSIRQEVSAALNRSTGSLGTHDHVSPDDESIWECVRNGLCCICCESNIDSLLYRCGHMCTCSKCSNELLESRRKCPMCRAPVVDVIRAYSIQ